MQQVCIVRNIQALLLISTYTSKLLNNTLGTKGPQNYECGSRSKPVQTAHFIKQTKMNVTDIFVFICRFNTSLHGSPMAPLFGLGISSMQQNRLSWLTFLFLGDISCVSSSAQQRAKTTNEIYIAVHINTASMLVKVIGVSSNKHVLSQHGDVVASMLPIPTFMHVAAHFLDGKIPKTSTRASNSNIG